MEIEMSLLYFAPIMLLLRYFIVSSLALPASSVKNITTDQHALLAFKEQLIDPRGILTYNWSVSYPVCRWVGISCDTRHHRVTKLDLSDSSLEGPISAHLGNISFLVSLNISGNNFHGHLPNELRQLRRLKLIDFNFNQLSGVLPSWIGSLPKLRMFSLRNNSFRGPFPDYLYNLSKLETLEMRFNIVGGKIPTKIGNLSKLLHLNLGNNNLQGEIPDEIGNLQNLQNLLLFHNKLTGHIPSAIFNLSTVNLITLAANELSGHLPSTAGNSLQNMEILDLSENRLIGTIPNSITNASRLYALDLSFNYFSGHIPNTFGKLRHLARFTIMGNNLTIPGTSSSTEEDWSFLSSLTNCRDIKRVVLALNPFGGILPPLVGNFSSSLEQFFAYDCQLKGNIPEEIGNLHGLITLSLQNNELNGTIPTSLGRLEKLQSLSLHQNNLQGPIPYELCYLKGLNSLLFYENKLTGSIPPCLASLTSLRNLLLGSNNLTSIIPSSLWTLEGILQIDLSSNSLTGSLPSSMKSLKALILLDLSRNQLSGDIPTAIGGLQELLNLSLAGNLFQGHIPESFGNLTSLEILDLSSNNLSGEIPKSLEKLLYLKHLNVSHNILEGKIPENGPFRNFSAQSFMWNYALCGSPRLQVPPCKDDGTVRRSKKAIVTLFLKYVLPPIVSILLIMTVVVFMRRRNKAAMNSAHQEDFSPLATWRRVSYLEIQRATNGFDECNLLGKGSFGSVYKGILSDGAEVAIKIFNLQLKRAFRSFDSECEVLRSIRHRNLVKILSSCSNVDFKALVLEFMPNGSLEKWLYSHNYFLDIQERLNVMIDVGSALEYLHHGYSPSVVHCDLKPSNILLDENMVAHVSDFGISKLLGDGENFETRTMTMATVGYMAPEYGSEGIVSSKCDVYSYGVLLMETFTRKKPTDEIFAGEMSLKNWVKESLPHGLTNVVDENLLLEEPAFAAKMDCMLSIMYLALDCSMDSPDQRICMKDAVARLNKIRLKFLNDISEYN
ncbi:receptor kinase-like protein Xa21 isoform X1 [Citrus sinensis]|uniref:receptor kinase-like protein Xa21 isoform X1 n=1 Tax=Citrus sinensis TaxID=2711 RepID=UPI002279311A|nr:receptor kinase-like protein Xa21 isoform X1 [Citrus sinensis]